MSETVYRVQNSIGQGPFRYIADWSWSWTGPPLNSAMKQSVQLFFSPAMKRGVQWVFDTTCCPEAKRLGRPGEILGYGVRRPEQILYWIKPEVQPRLAELGFAFVELFADRILWEDERQIVFARAQPLRIAAKPIPWPVPPPRRTWQPSDGLFVR